MRSPLHRTWASDRLSAGAVLPVAFAAIGAALVVAVMRYRVPVEPSLWNGGVFTAALLMARLVRTRLPQGDEVRIDVMVGLTGLALLPIELLLVAVVTAGIIESVVDQTQDRGSLVTRFLDTPRRAAILAILSPFQLTMLPADQGQDSMLLPLILAGLAYVALDVTTVAVQLRLLPHGLGPSGVLSVFRPLASVYLVHIAMAAVTMRVYPALGMSALAITLLLTLILQNGFNLYLRIRRAYAETIGALAQAAELDRPEDTGHARRVADLSVAVGRRIGLRSHELEHIDYAALLHDVGRIGYDDDSADAGHALRSAEIVGAVPFLEPVAPLIARHHDPDLAGGDPLPVGAAIVGVCSDYDRLERQHGARRALDMLRGTERGVRLLVVDELSEVLVDLAARTRQLP